MKVVRGILLLVIGWVSIALLAISKPVRSTSFEHEHRSKLKANSKGASALLSVLSVSLSVITFLLLYVPIQDLSYTVQTVQNNSLPVGGEYAAQPSFFDAFDITVNVINRGNQPATVSAISVYVMPVKKSQSPDDSYCIREKLNFQLLYLYEHDLVDPTNMRGTATAQDFGKKIVPLFAVGAHSTASDEHRFSLFNQEAPYLPAEISGLLCITVAVTTSSGEYRETPEALAWLDVRNGERLAPGSNIFRLNTSNFAHKVDRNLSSFSTEGLASRVVVRRLYRNWLSYLDFSWLF